MTCIWRPPLYGGHFCQVPRVAAIDRFDCISFQVPALIGWMLAIGSGLTLCYITYDYRKDGAHACMHAYIYSIIYTHILTYIYMCVCHYVCVCVCMCVCVCACVRADGQLWLYQRKDVKTRKKWSSEIRK